MSSSENGNSFKQQKSPGMGVRSGDWRDVTKTSSLASGVEGFQDLKAHMQLLPSSSEEELLHWTPLGKSWQRLPDWTYTTCSPENPFTGQREWATWALTPRRRGPVVEEGPGGPGALTGKGGFSTEEWGESEQAETIDAHCTCCSRFTPFPFTFHFFIQSSLEAQIVIGAILWFHLHRVFFFRLSWGSLSTSHFPSLVSFLLFTVSLWVLGTGIGLRHLGCILGFWLLTAVTCTHVSSPDCLQVSLLMVSRWFRQQAASFQGPAADKPMGARALGAPWASRGKVHQFSPICIVRSLRQACGCTVIAVWNALAWPILTCLPSV